MLVTPVMSGYLFFTCACLFACVVVAGTFLPASSTSHDQSTPHDISVTLTPDGSDGYILSVYGSIEPQNDAQDVLVYVRNMTPVPMPLGGTTIDKNGFFNMTDRFGNGLYFEGFTMHLDVRYGDRIYEIWYPEMPSVLLADLDAMEEEFCANQPCETFYSWFEPMQQTYLRALYYKDCDDCTFDVYDVEVVDGQLVMYLEGTEKNKDVDRHML